MTKSYDPPLTTKESLKKLVKDIEDIPDGKVDRHFINNEIKKIIKEIK